MGHWPYGKPIIGLVGAVGAGKSLVAGQLEELGCGVIDADALAREALERPEVRREVLERWGADLLDKEGQIHRGRLGDLVFDDPKQLVELEAMLHPPVYAGRRLQRKQFLADPAVKAVVEDVPLLFEAGLDRDCDVVVFVSADRQRRIDRVAAGRGWTASELDRRQKIQLSLDIKADCADYVIDNNGGEPETFSHVRSVLFDILHNR